MNMSQMAISDTFLGMEKMVGYARINAEDGDICHQLEALEAAGCTVIFTDRVSGQRDARPELDRALAALEPGDTFAVSRLDRPGRSVRHVVALVNSLSGRGINLLILDGSLDSRTAEGQKILPVFTAMADLEKDRHRELAGSLPAVRGARAGGRPALLTTEQAAKARELYSGNELTVAQIGAKLGVSRATVYRALAERDGVPGRRNMDSDTGLLSH